MRLSLKLAIGLLAFGFILPIQQVEAQKKSKRLKRPSSRVGISTVDKFVQESFNLYDKVYRFDGYHESGKSLTDDDYEILIDAVEDGQEVLASAPNAVSALDGAGVLKQGKGTLQINRAKKALTYSLKTAKKLLTTKPKKNDDETESTIDTSNDNDSNNTSENSSTNENVTVANQIDVSNISDNLEIYSKFDFVPGDKLLFFDDFSKDYIGDFPSKWNTNGGGEVVSINDEKWFELLSGYGNYYIPDVKNLPEEYTIEFDVLVNGVDKKTSSTAKLNLYISNSDAFSHGTTYVSASIPFCQYVATEIRVRNYINRGGGGINNGVKADIRKAVLNQPHIAIAVNKQRYRIWVNEKKYIDVPRMLPTDNSINYIKFNAKSFKDGKERIFIKNLKVSEGGEDLRRKLIEEGSYSTNGILFDSGSANIQPQSYGIIRQISQALLQVKDMKLNIIGHTDSDGPDDINLKLSKKRAEAVKNALITIYKISGERLQTDGNGESKPVGDNKTSDGKAQNRRVEFVKI